MTYETTSLQEKNNTILHPLIINVIRLKISNLGKINGVLDPQIILQFSRPGTLNNILLITN